MRKFFKNRRKLCITLAIMTLMVLMLSVSVSATGGSSTDSTFIPDAIDAIVDTITGFADGASNAVITVFENVFMDADGGISNFALYSLFFLGFGIIAGLIGSVIKKIG